MTEEDLLKRAVTRGHALLLLNHADILVKRTDGMFRVLFTPVYWTLSHEGEGVVLRLEAEPTADGVAIVPREFCSGEWEQSFIAWVYQAVADHEIWKLRRVLIDEVAAELGEAALAEAVPFADEDEYDPGLDHHRDRQAQLP